MIESAVFYILAAALLGFALMTITRTNPIAAAMAMVGAFGALAGLYATLSAGFLAVIQVLVYAGGIMVLVIFVIMLLNLHVEDLKPMRVKAFTLLLALFATLTGIVAPILFYVLPAKDWSFAPLAPGFGTIASVGEKVFTDYLFPFEILSLVLLTAVVGALVLAKRKL